MKIQESKPEDQDKVRNVPLKMKGTEQSVNFLFSWRKKNQATRRKDSTNTSWPLIFRFWFLFP